MVLLLIVGTLPLFAVLLINDQVEALGNNPIFVSCALLVTGCILFLSDRMAKGRKTTRNRPHRHGEGRTAGGRGPGLRHRPRLVPVWLYHLRRYGPGL